MTEIGLCNFDGQMVDTFIPRKCSATNMMIGPKDHNSVQIQIAKVNENGLYKGDKMTFALCGAVRKQGNCDAALNILCQKAGLVQLE